MEMPIDYVLALQGYMRAVKAPAVEAWEKEKARTAALHEALRTGRAKV
jgi:hypothetical protein